MFSTRVTLLILLGLMGFWAGPAAADGMIFKRPLVVADPWIPDQRALLQWEDGNEVLVIETSVRDGGEVLPGVSPGRSARNLRMHWQKTRSIRFPLPARSCRNGATGFISTVTFPPGKLLFCVVREKRARHCGSSPARRQGSCWPTGVPMALWTDGQAEFRFGNCRAIG